MRCFFLGDFPSRVLVAQFFFPISFFQRENPTGKGPTYWCDGAVLPTVDGEQQMDAFSPRREQQMGYVPPSIETGAKTGFIFTINSRWSCFFERSLWNVRNQQFRCFQFGYSSFPSLERRGFPHARLAFKWLMKQFRTDFSLDAGQLDIGNSGKALRIINQHIHQRIIFLPGKVALHGTYKFFHPRNGGNHQWSGEPPFLASIFWT